MMRLSSSSSSSFASFLLVLLLVLATAQARIFDRFFAESDLCATQMDNGELDVGVCDHSRFPVCDDAKELVCYNRRPFRNRFYEDSRQPYFYIDYKSVYCYPDTWAGCSSCTPGRFCLSEQRCILQDAGYDCAQWI